MEFHRFEQLQSHHFNPHLSSTRGPIIEGEQRVGSSDVIHVAKGGAYRWRVPEGTTARYTIARSTSCLEAEIAKNGASDNWRG